MFIGHSGSLSPTFIEKLILVGDTYTLFYVGYRAEFFTSIPRGHRVDDILVSTCLLALRGFKGKENVIQVSRLKISNTHSMRVLQ